MKKIILLPPFVLFCFFILPSWSFQGLQKGIAGDKKDPANAAGGTVEPVLLPSQFINGERFYLKLATINNDTLLGFCDTGGGISMAFPPAIDKFHLKSKVKTGALKGFFPMKYIPFYDIVKDPNIPAPIQSYGRELQRGFKNVPAPILYVPKMDAELRFIFKNMPTDVFFGQNFFMGKSWTFDYIHRQVWVNTPLAATEEGKPGVQKIGFKKNEKGESIYGHPSMYIEVAGEKIDVLFDAGATIIFSDSTMKALNTDKRTIGGSFIAASVFDKWCTAHPDWKFYPKADYHKDMIEVPLVKIGGYEVGPVFFSKRPDEAWSKGMISTMDKVVKGAIGGSGLKYLKVTIDYNSELIKFER